jgi:cell division cycle 2-like protein
VYRARCKGSGKIFALKKLKMENCPDGFPQTSVREINVLLSLHHPNIVNVQEVGAGPSLGAVLLSGCHDEPAPPQHCQRPAFDHL